ncbi:tetratricopeptide repeat protein [Microbulbifer marinus]|uniref:Tfp pilus assembly protein PilF n=1 Tax=Microbulbifer marinus TaxID=658218 RepID=A0A1H4AFP1_9GAMM|nr:tetratricopeptide repeat protein [Microbulbifer marinus]SEA34893.1 Tfp pilus assembly protein PilF [Microbulbifer marinus]
MNKKPANPQLLTSLYGMINSGQASLALPQIQQLLSNNAKDPNVLHLAALAHAATGNTAEAKHFFTQTLKVNGRQPAAHNNFANFLKQQNMPEQARQHYHSATALAPKFSDAWRNLAILEYELAELDPAYKHAQKASEIAPNNPAAYTLLGNICRKSDRHEDAIEYFQRAINLKPNYVNAIYGLAITYTALEENERAITLLEQALRINPGTAEFQYATALAQLNLGEYQQALTTLEELLKNHPLYIDAHRTLNEVYWQQGDQAAFCSSYKNIPSPQRQNIAIAIAHIENLLAVNRVEEAERELDNNWNDSRDPRILFLRGKVAEEQGDIGSATLQYEEAFTQHPELTVAKQFFIALIKSAQFDRAEKLISDYLNRAPDDQLLWALQGTCWKMLGDPRYHWLTKDNAFVQRFEIPTPNGYANKNEFLDQLKETLIEMHNLKAQPLNQSVRAGVQTPGRLLHKKHPVIMALRSSLAEIVTEYISALPTDKTHPLLRRKSGDFVFSGSWSVLLKGGGHHVSHVHPQGWISSAFYVAVPQVIPDEANKDGGDIYFGRSPYELGSRDMIEKQVTPEAGTLVLFPSYTWHGTVPLSGNEEKVRITTPFDAVPAAKTDK